MGYNPLTGTLPWLVWFGTSVYIYIDRAAVIHCGMTAVVFKLWSTPIWSILNDARTEDKEATTF